MSHAGERAGAFGTDSTSTSGQTSTASAVTLASAPNRPRVFLSHRRADHDRAEALSTILREQYGIEPWFDGWEIAPGDEFIPKMEDGLTRTDGGLILVTEQSVGEGWMYREYAGLLLRVVEHPRDSARPRSFLIPVLERSNLPVPEFLRQFSPVLLSEPHELARAILRHLGLADADKPELGALWQPVAPLDLELRLQRHGDVISIQSSLGPAEQTLTRSDAAALRRQIRTQGVTRDRPNAAATTGLVEVGRHLGKLFDGDLGRQLLDKVTAQQAQGETRLRLRSNDPELLALPWEAAHLGTLGPLALIRNATLSRELENKTTNEHRRIVGPLRILVAVAAPNEDLDHPRELGVMLEAAEAASAGRPRLVFIDEAARTLDGIRRGVPLGPLRQVAQAAGLDWSDEDCRKAIRLLSERTLLTNAGSGQRDENHGKVSWQRSWFAHRWTAKSLTEALTPETLKRVHIAAADWWLGPKRLDWDDALEGVEHLVAAEEWKRASKEAGGLRDWAQDTGHPLTAVRLCEQMIDALLADPFEQARWLGMGAQQLRALGDIPGARKFLERAEGQLEALRAQQADNECERVHAVILSELGGLHMALGNEELAKSYDRNALEAQYRPVLELLEQKLRQS